MEVELVFGKYHIATSINVRISRQMSAKCVPITHEALGSILVRWKLNMVGFSCSPSPQKVKAGGSEIVGHSCQHNEFKGSLGHVTPCLRYMSKRRIKKVGRVNVMRAAAHRAGRPGLPVSYLSVAKGRTVALQRRGLANATGIR